VAPALVKEAYEMRGFGRQEICTPHIYLLEECPEKTEAGF
jgi:hypothetical protein